VYDYGGGGGSSTSSRLVPAADVGLSSTGNTIGVLNTEFAPATITNPDRVLFGLPSNFVISPGSGVVTPVNLNVNFSSSTNVDIVSSAPLGVTRFPGSQGFYFRTQLKSDYYYMVGYVSGKKVLYLFTVPQGTNLASVTLSQVPGIVSRFRFFEDGARLSSGNLNTLVTPEEAPRPSSRFSVDFEQSFLSQIGRAQKVPIQGASLLIGEAVNTVADGITRYRPIVDSVVFTCFS
jgi:hypothetical protein